GARAAPSSEVRERSVSPRPRRIRYGGLLHGPEHGKRRGRLSHETAGRCFGFLAMGSGDLGGPWRLRWRGLDSLCFNGTSVPASIRDRIPNPPPPTGTLGPRVPLCGGQ